MGSTASSSGVIHSTSLWGKWIYGTLSHQLLLSSSNHITAGRTTVRCGLGCSQGHREPITGAGGLAGCGCWEKWHLQAASREHPTGHPRPPLPLDHLRGWDAINRAGEGLGAPPGVDARGRGFLLVDAWRHCKQRDTVRGPGLSCCIPRLGTALPCL